MSTLAKLSYLARTAYYVARRPRLHRSSTNVAEEYSEGWNQYWEHLGRSQTLDQWLRIPTVEDRPAFFNVDGKLSFQAFDSSNFYREALLRALKAHFPSARSITEFGAGLGRNLLYIKRRSPELSVCGYELCKPGVEIGSEAAKKFNLDSRYSQLNYLTARPDEYVFPPADVAFTMFSLEQIPRENKQAVKNILGQSRLGSIHIEPVPENYPLNVRGILGRLDHWKVDYLTSFDRNVRQLGLSGVARERLTSSPNPLMYPLLYVLRK